MQHDAPNPYAATELVTEQGMRGDVVAANAGMVKHVMIVGILQVVEGVLELLLGGFLILAAAFLGMAIQLQPPSNQPPPPEEMMAWVEGIYMAIGAVVSALAILRILSGIACFWFRSRLFTIISLFAGLLTSITCYCGPFSIGLCIYGLIVMFNPAVAQAYQMAKQGASRNEITGFFATLASR